jgi:chemotaxis protein methyltransferase WspC
MKIPPAIAEQLRELRGLELATLGEASVRGAGQRRRAAAGADSDSAYAALVLRSAKEFDALAEELLVPESWFFRDEAPFRFLETWAREQWRPAAAGRVLRVLSVPCAAGQEAYSIAITLLEAGLRAGEFVVEAGDISEKLLEQARAGAYPPMAFRGRELGLREKYFEPAEKRTRRVRAEVRASVRFRRCNLVDADFLRGEPPFPVVFSRNVLIYFDGVARKRAIAHLRRQLAPGGLLFSGHADSLPVLDPGFVSAGPPGSFAYRLRTATTGLPAARRATRREKVTRPAGRTRAALATVAATGTATAVTEVKRGPATVVLAEARRLADAGALAEAERGCREFLQKHGPQAEAFFLLGQLAAARDRRAEAENFYRRALYLDARHADAALQLALLADHRGDRTGAARLRQRARA